LNLQNIGVTLSNTRLMSGDSKERGLGSSSEIKRAQADGVPLPGTEIITQPIQTAIVVSEPFAQVQLQH